MSPPAVRVNTFVQPNDTQPVVDSISKIFIIGELVLGVNRLPVLTTKYVYIIVTVIYSLFVIGNVLYLKYVEEQNELNLFILLNISVYIFCNVSSFIFCKRIKRYYYELNTFDAHVGCKPKNTRGSIKNVAQMCITTAYIVILFIVFHLNNLEVKLMYPIFVHVAQCLEVHYYGHLLNLLTPRLRLINYYMQISLSHVEDTKISILNEFIFYRSHDKTSNCQMKKLTDSYSVIIKSYNFLNEAIKWQLLFLLMASFVSVLGFSYKFSLNVRDGQSITQSSVFHMGLTIAVMLPLFAPCVFGEQVRSEVRRLRELLASRLYENKLDKSSRSIARALLAFTETRDLSFSLLRILNIDISLPFKFVGLLVTYLIILLQFEKVINV